MADLVGIGRIVDRDGFARHASVEAVQAHLDVARRRAAAATRDVEWLENLLTTRLDRRHAGLSIPCEVCDGPCRIDEVAPQAAANPDPQPECEHEWHGADGGACPACGWDSHPIPGGERRG